MGISANIFGHKEIMYASIITVYVLGMSLHACYNPFPYMGQAESGYVVIKRYFDDKEGRDNVT